MLKLLAELTEVHFPCHSAGLDSYYESVAPRNAEPVPDRLPARGLQT